MNIRVQMKQSSFIRFNDKFGKKQQNEWHIKIVSPRSAAFSQYFDFFA